MITTLTKHPSIRVILTILISITIVRAVCAQQNGESIEALRNFEIERTDQYEKQLETHLQQWLTDEYQQRAAHAWNRDYTSEEAFVQSVTPNRERWRNVIQSPTLIQTGSIQRQPHSPLSDLNAEWLTIPLGGITAEALFVVPEHASADQPVPIIIVQHGIGSFPERAFGLLDDGDHYHRYARELVHAGFAVLAPMNLRSVERRNRIERLCRLAGFTLPGMELVRMQYLLDSVLNDSRIQRDQVGMWGVSLGGMATMFWMPLEPKIKAGIVCAWFNHRRNKMAIPDPRYSCFLDTTEEHAFFNGWLTEFTDSDVISLICPRPLLIQHGKKDRIAHWPQVVEEFNTSKMHYEKLGIANRIEIDLHEGGHESRVESGIRFLTRWLKK